MAAIRSACGLDDAPPDAPPGAPPPAGVAQAAWPAIVNAAATDLLPPLKQVALALAADLIAAGFADATGLSLLAQAAQSIHLPEPWAEEACLAAACPPPPAGAPSLSPAVLAAAVAAEPGSARFLPESGVKELRALAAAPAAGPLHQLCTCLVAARDGKDVAADLAAAVSAAVPEPPAEQRALFEGAANFIVPHHNFMPLIRLPLLLPLAHGSVRRGGGGAGGRARRSGECWAECRAGGGAGRAARELAAGARKDRRDGSREQAGGAGRLPGALGARGAGARARAGRRGRSGAADRAAALRKSGGTILSAPTAPKRLVFVIKPLHFLVGWF